MSAQNTTDETLVPPSWRVVQGSVVLLSAPIGALTNFYIVLLYFRHAALRQRAGIAGIALVAGCDAFNSLTRIVLD